MSDDNNGVRKKPDFFKPPKKGQFKFSIWFFVAAIVAILAVNSFVSSAGETKIEYSTFKSMVANGSIQRVAIGESSIFGYTASADSVDGTTPGNGFSQHRARFTRRRR